MSDFVTVEPGKYIPRLLLDICCDQDINGEHKLLETIIQNSDPTVHIFDVGARNSKFPNFSNTHNFHLFDPKFIYEPGVDYDKHNVKVNNQVLNSTNKTLDEYCEQQNIKNIEYLKIDTDGYDIDVLEGSLKMLPHIKYIQVEHDIFHLFKKVNLNRLYEILKGYNIYKITFSGLQKVDKIEENYIYSNYLFTKCEDIYYEPYVVNTEYILSMHKFWNVTQDTVMHWLKTTSGPFITENRLSSFDKKSFLKNYFVQYFDNFIESLSI